MGTLRTFFSFRAGSSCSRYGWTFGSVGVTSFVLKSEGSDAGGSYATGTVDIPQMFWPVKG
jgi:hypothetical protein